MLFLSVRGFSDYAGPKQPLAICAAVVLPSSYSEWSRRPDLRAFRSSIAPPTDASVYASRNISRCPLQDSRSGWIRYFLSCRALASPTTCRFIPAHSGLPVAALLGTLIIPHFGWRAMFVLGGVGALVVWYLRKALPESPRWLESISRTAEAETLLQSIEGEVSREHGPLPQPVS